MSTTSCCRDDRWVLVTVRLTADLEIAGVGSVPREWIAANVPRDDGPFGSWASAKLKIPNDVITNGIPQLGEHCAGLLPFMVNMSSRGQQSG